MDPFISSFAISVAAGIALDILKTISSKITNQSKQAFNKALVNWSPNSSIRNNKENYLRAKVNQLFSNYSSLNKEINDDSELKTFIDEYRKVLLLPQYKLLNHYLNTTISEFRHEEILSFFDIEKHIHLNYENIGANWFSYKNNEALVRNEMKIVYPYEMNPNSPLFALFNDYLVSEKWSCKLKKRIEYLIRVTPSIKVNKRFLKAINDLDYDIKYELIAANILRILKNQIIGRNNDEKSKIKVAIESVKHLCTGKLVIDNCFLVTGSKGAGKTHLIQEILEQQSGIYPIYLDYSNWKYTFTESIISIVSDFTNNRVTDIFDLKILFDSFEDKNIVFILDDLELLLRGNKKLLDELINLIKEFSFYSNVVWLISLDINSYQEVISSDNFFEYVSYFHPKNLKKNEIKKLPCFISWLNLDQYNVNNRVGFSIIKKHVDERILDTINVNIYKHLSSPIFANMLCEYYNSIKFDISLDFQLDYFVDFYHLFQETFINRIPINEGVDSALIASGLNMICHEVIECEEFQFGRNSLQNKLVHFIAEKLQYTDGNDRAIKIIKSLIFLNFLEQNRKGFSYDTPDNLKLNYIFYWPFKIAEQKILKSVSEYEEKILHSTNAQYRDILYESIEFFLLLCIRNNDNFIPDIENILLSKSISNHIVFTSLIKENDDIKLDMFKYLAEDKSNFTNYIYGSQDIYTLIRYVFSFSTTVENIFNKIEYLTKFKSQISNYLVASVYFDFLKKEIATIFNEKILQRIFKVTYNYFEFAEKYNEPGLLTESLSHSIFTQIATVLRWEPNKIERFLIDQMSSCQPNDESVYMKNKRKYQTLRIYMGEWYLFHFTNFITSALGFKESFNFFIDSKWYSKERTNNEALSEGLIHEAGLSLGRHYYSKAISNKAKGSYPVFLKSIIRTKDPVMVERCFYIVKHTVPIPYKMKVNKCFLNILEDIFRDFSNAEFVLNNIKVFKVNGIN